MNRKAAGHLIGVAVLLLLVLYLNDLFVEQRLERYLVAHPEIVTRALAGQAAEKRASREADISRNLVTHWDDVAGTLAYAVQYDGHSFISRLVPISQVATSATLNLIATDYRCGYCKADRARVETLLKSHPHHEFVFLEAAVLGPESIRLAESALSEASREPLKYYGVHHRYFDAVQANTPSVEPDAERLAKTHRDIAAEVGINGTPTYVLSGMSHIGTLAAEN